MTLHRYARAFLGGNRCAARLCGTKLSPFLQTSARGWHASCGAVVDVPAAPPEQDRPSHFLAFQISHAPSVVAAINTVHTSMASYQGGLLRGALVDAASAHITIAVMRLGAPGHPSMSEAVACLEDVRTRLLADGTLQPFTLPVQGLSQFNNRVLFLDLPPSPGLHHMTQLAAITRDAYQAAGLLHRLDKPFLPHATIAKCSRSRRRLRDIPPESYAPHVDISAGSVTVHELQLCSMLGRPRHSYYSVDYALPLEE